MANVLDAVKEEKSRIEKANIVCNMLRTVMETAPDDLLPTVYLLACMIPPAHEGLELGIVDVVIRKAIVLTFGITEEHITELLKDHKDLGAVANTCRSSQSLMCKPKALTALKVFDTFQPHQSLWTYLNLSNRMVIRVLDMDLTLISCLLLLGSLIIAIIHLLICHPLSQKNNTIKGCLLMICRHLSQKNNIIKGYLLMEEKHQCQFIHQPAWQLRHAANANSTLLC